MEGVSACVRSVCDSVVASMQRHCSRVKRSIESASSCLSDDDIGDGQWERSYIPGAPLLRISTPKSQKLWMAGFGFGSLGASRLEHRLCRVIAMVSCPYLML